jgi:hypothetical protein
MANSHTQAALEQFANNTETDAVAFHEKEVWDDLPEGGDGFNPAEFKDELDSIANRGQTNPIV